VLLDEIDRRTVAEAGIDGAVEQVPAVEDVVDRQPYRQPEQILVLDVEARNPRQVERPLDLGQ
jgi:hypothetical protein